MTRGNARELALHLIYAQEFTGEPPLETVNDRLKEEYRPPWPGNIPFMGRMPLLSGRTSTGWSQALRTSRKN